MTTKVPERGKSMPKFSPFRILGNCRSFGHRFFVAALRPRPVFLLAFSFPSKLGEWGVDVWVIKADHARQNDISPACILNNKGELNSWSKIRRKEHTARRLSTHYRIATWEHNAFGKRRKNALFDDGAYP